MTKIRLEIEQKEINELGCKQFELSLYDCATIIDAIIEVDKLISARGKFPTEKIYLRTKMKCYSLLHMIYNPLEKRMYKDVLVSELSGPEMSIKIKYKPELILSDGLTITIILKPLCGDEAPEELIDYEVFRQTMLKQGYKIS
jgi:hypothetical protein